MTKQQRIKEFNEKMQTKPQFMQLCLICETNWQLTIHGGVFLASMPSFLRDLAEAKEIMEMKEYE